jgi:hypothetical protein
VTKEEVVELRRSLRGDLIRFGYFVCSNLTPDITNCQLHKDIATFHHTRPPLAVVIAPRGHSKTTWGSTISTAHDIAYDSEKVIILLKKTFAQAVTDLQNVLNIIRYNQTFRALYGERKFLIDRQERVHILNPYTGHKTWIEAKGAGQSIRGIVVDGSRVTKMTLDDFEDENNTSTAEQRLKVRDWISAQIMPGLDPKLGHILALGTIVHSDSWLNNVYEGWKKAKTSGRTSAWQLVFHQVMENGVPIWPERFSVPYIETLKQSYEELGRVGKFYQEYYNIPVSDDEATFSTGLIKYAQAYYQHDPEVGNVLDINGKIVPVDIVVGIDPSTGVGRDYSGVVVVATDHENNRYIIKASREMLQPNELMNRVFELYSMYHPRVIIMEEQAMAVIMGYWLRDEMKNRNIFLPLRGEKAPNRQSKEDKLAQALQPIYAAGVIYHTSGCGVLEEELLTFPLGKHDDILDALYLAMLYVRRCANADVEQKRRKTTGRPAEYSWMTGARINEDRY